MRGVRMTRRYVLLLSVAVVMSGGCGDTGGVTVDPDSLVRADAADASVADAAPEALADVETPPDAALETRPEEVDTDVLEECPPGASCFGQPCSDNSDCHDGFCVEHMGQLVCSKQCIEDCPDGWTCKQVPGTEPDYVYICISDFPTLCRPCGADDDCESATGEQGKCVLYEAAGSFCSGPCSEETVCPEDYSCKEVSDAGGGVFSGCVLDSGICECTQMSIELGLGTPCEESNEFGTCPGERVCTEQGLSACNAPVPSFEVCNGEDDDCDDAVDNGACDDENECTEDSCDPASGCNYELLTGTPCSDDDLCTLTDHCEEGQCTGTPINCDDSNPCTDNGCDGLQGCVFVPNNDECDDGDPCTVGDKCFDSVCGGVLGLGCDDGNDCTYGETCQTGVCAGGKPLNCNDGNQCTSDSCDEETGCVHENLEGACNDGNACTLGDHCQDGQCAFDEQATCDDDNPCTDDSCDPKIGCVHDENSNPCDDGNLCTKGDQCKSGICTASSQLNCDDGNECTFDSCEAEEGCVHIPNNKPCSDANMCTANDFCLGGECVPGSDMKCDDENECTDDSCNPLLGCVQSNNSGPCDDLDPCSTSDQCSGGMCVGIGQMDCDDDNPCTDDSCQPMVGCDHENNSNPCEDGNACTSGDHCLAGMCVGGPPPDCDDSNPCTTDSCDPMEGCKNEANNLPCDDNNKCTENDSCLDGTCQPGEPVDCNDDEICTTDYCTPSEGCGHALNQVPCNDNDVCTINDHCHLGMCIGGGDLNCNDKNTCTDDSCNSDSGCVFTVNNAACDDSNECTLNEQCVNGSCVSGEMIDCDDDNICTDDACDPLDGCGHANNSVACDDGDQCTVGEKCDGGACQGGVGLNCDDGNVCTDDSCDPDAGCGHVNNNAACDDENQCTENDSCLNGACQPGTPKNCDDGDPCSVDTCDPDNGCQHAGGGSCCGNGVVDPGEECDDGNNNNNDFCNNNCKFGGAVFNSYSKEGRKVYIFKSDSNAPLSQYNSFCESMGLAWFVPKSQSDAQFLITHCYDLDKHHTWIITKNKTTAGTFGGYSVSVDSAGCVAYSNSGFSAIRKWACSYCEPENHGHTKCWDSGHSYDWLVCEGG